MKTKDLYYWADRIDVAALIKVADLMAESMAGAEGKRTLRDAASLVKLLQAESKEQ